MYNCLRKRESLGLWVFRVRGVLGLKENGKACRLRFEGILVSGGGKRGMWWMSRVTTVEVFFLFAKVTGCRNDFFFFFFGNLTSKY